MFEVEDMIVFTPKRAAERLYPISPGAVALGVVYLEDAAPLAINFESLERVVEFIKELRPNSVRLESHINEDCTPYVAALSDYATHTKH